MYEICVQRSFSGAHHLRGYHGKCERQHGHNWKVQIYIKGSRLDKAGLLFDFVKLREGLNGVLARLDHQDLNKVPPFNKENVSSENLARYIFDAMGRKIAAAARAGRARGCSMSRVTIWETENSFATYSPD